MIPGVSQLLAVWSSQGDLESRSRRTMEEEVREGSGEPPG
jgi:hypothetical protein